MNTEDILSLKEKKVVRWHEGLVVFIGPEAKKFGWNESTKVRIIATKNKDKEQIIIERS